MALQVIIPTLKEFDMEEIFCKDNFFTDSEIDFLIERINLLGSGLDYTNHEGPFANLLLANYLRISDRSLLDWLHEKVKNTVDRPFNIVSGTRVMLYLPWDVHNDYHKNECRPGHLPYYNFLIPIGNYQSRTVIFDQYSTESTNFSDYKNTHAPLDKPVSEEVWEENLSMCWPQDRQYLSIKSILPWQRCGQLIGFPSKYFHSSDNFHLKIAPPKVFLQIRTEINA
jgi:hypothetical protein